MHIQHVTHALWNIDERVLIPTCGHNLLHLCRSTNVQEALNMAIMLVDVSYPKWRILFCNTQVDKATGLSGSEISGQHVWDHFNVVGKAEVGFKSCCCGSMYGPMYLSIFLSVRLSVHSAVSPYTCLSVWPSVCVSVSLCLPFHFQGLSVCL